MSILNLSEVQGYLDEFLGHNIKSISIRGNTETKDVTYISVEVDNGRKMVFSLSNYREPITTICVDKTSMEY